MNIFGQLISQSTGVRACLARPDEGTDRHSVMTRCSASTTALRGIVSAIGMDAYARRLDDLEAGTRSMLWNWESLSREEIRFYMEQYADHARSLARHIESGDAVFKGDYQRKESDI